MAIEGSAERPPSPVSLNVGRQTFRFPVSRLRFPMIGAHYVEQVDGSTGRQGGERWKMAVSPRSKYDARFLKYKRALADSVRCSG